MRRSHCACADQPEQNCAFCKNIGCACQEGISIGAVRAFLPCQPGTRNMAGGRRAIPSIKQDGQNNEASIHVGLIALGSTLSPHRDQMRLGRRSSHVNLRRTAHIRCRSRRQSAPAAHFHINVVDADKTYVLRRPAFSNPRAE